MIHFMKNKVYKIPTGKGGAKPLVAHSLIGVDRIIRHAIIFEVISDLRPRGFKTFCMLSSTSEVKC